MLGGAAFTVALVGPDGVGKTTIARRLEREFPFPLKYLYMGDNVDSSNVMLPTTRWWKRRQKRLGVKPEPPRMNAAPGRSRRAWRRPLRPLRKGLGFANRIFEEIYRQSVATRHSRRGCIVLFDRHFALDYHHFDVAPGAGEPSLKRRLHGFFLRHLIRLPDLVICLDAPGAVVFRRKGEFSPEFLEMRRWQYRDFEHLVHHFELVDADRELDLVVQDVREAILHFEEERHHDQK